MFQKLPVQLPTNPAERRLFWVVMLSALLITFREYFGNGADWSLHVAQLTGETEWLDSFWRKVFWASGTLLAYLIIPLLFARILQLRIRDLGFRWHFPWNHARWYLLAFGFMLPLLILASRLPSFQNTYPFYRFESGTFPLARFAIWECVYFLQFVAVEFFFRGWLIHGTKPALGSNALYLSILPYVMIHFGKPLPETLGALGAGFILGQLSYRFGSIIPGILLHFGVAFSMDVLSLYQRGYFG